MKKEMYRVQIEVTTQQSGRIHLERESYRKTKECRLFSSTTPAVATVATAFAEGKPNEFVAPFRIEDASRGVPKFVVAQVIEADSGGEYSVAELREQLRESLAEAKAIRRLIDTLKQETYVSVRL